MIPSKGSIPRRKPKELGDLLKGVLGGLIGELSGEVGNLLNGILKGLGKTLESVQNLNLGDLVKLAETQGSEEAKEKIAELKKMLGEKGISDLFGEGLDLSKLVDFAVKHGGKGMVQSGIRGHILGIPLVGKDLPLERRESQGTKFEVKGTRPQEARKAPEKTVTPQDLDVHDMEIDPIEEDEKFFKVCGYIAGVEEGIITCEVNENGTLLGISAKGKRKYEKEIELSSPVTQEVKWSYRNGVLEIILEKKRSE